MRSDGTSRRAGIRARGFARVGAICALLVHTIAAIGVIPSPAYLSKLTGHAVGEAYPCASGRCGCSSARECWTTCACQTLEQKLRWAERQGVSVPDYVDRSTLDASKDDAGAACALCHDGGAAESDPAPVRGMPTLSALGCKGIQTLLGLAPPITILRGLSVESLLLEAESAQIAIRSERIPESRTLDQPSPPPRA